MGLIFFLFEPSGQYLHLVFWSDEYLEFLKWTKLPVVSNFAQSLSAFQYSSYISIFFLFAPSSTHIQNSNHHRFSSFLLGSTITSHTQLYQWHIRRFIASHALNLFFFPFTSKPPCQNQGKPITLWSQYALILAGHSANGTASKRRDLIIFSRMIPAADSLLIEANFQIVCTLIQ